MMDFFEYARLGMAVDLLVDAVAKSGSAVELRALSGEKVLGRYAFDASADGSYFRLEDFFLHLAHVILSGGGTGGKAEP